MWCSLLALYPNLEDLGEYMGLSLNSDEVQRNMALVPMADNVSIVGSFNPPSTTRKRAHLLLMYVRWRVCVKDVSGDLGQKCFLLIGWVRDKRSCLWMPEYYRSNRYRPYIWCLDVRQRTPVPSGQLTQHILFVSSEDSTALTEASSASQNRLHSKWYSEVQLVNSEDVVSKCKPQGFNKRCMVLTPPRYIFCQELYKNETCSLVFLRGRQEGHWFWRRYETES